MQRGNLTGVNLEERNKDQLNRLGRREESSRCVLRQKMSQVIFTVAELCSRQQMI